MTKYLHIQPDHLPQQLLSRATVYMCHTSENLVNSLPELVKKSNQTKNKPCSLDLPHQINKPACEQTAGQTQPNQAFPIET